MAEFRIKSGLALGPFGGPIAYTNSVTGVQFAQANTNPTVTNGVLFLTANTSTTVITNFVAERGAQLGLTEEPPDGKVVVIMFQDDSTSLTNQSRLFLSSTLGTFNSGGILGLIAVNSAWYEMFRSINVQGSQSARTEVVTVTVANSFSVDVTFARVVNIVSTAANTVLQAFSGGQAYQEVTVIPTYATGSTLFVSNAGNILIGGTGAFLTSNSGAYKFMYAPSGGGGAAFKWVLVKGGVSN